MDPKCTQNSKKGVREYKITPDGFQDPKVPPPSQILDHFWVPFGSPKITKNRVFVKKGASRNAFLSISVVNTVFLDFFVDFLVDFS